MRRWPKYGLAALFLLPAVVITGFVIHKATMPRRLLSEHVVKHPLLDKWAAQPFAEFGQPTDIRQLVDQIQVTADPAVEKSLDDEKREALAASVSAFITYLHTGDYDDYVKFRFVVPSAYLTPLMSNFCQKSLQIPAAQIKDAPDLALSNYWGRVIGTSFTKYWIGLSVSNCQIQVTTATNVERTSVDRQKATLKMGREVENVGIGCAHGAVQYRPSASEIIATDKSVEVATIRLLPKALGVNGIYPVYLKCYWSPRDKKWLPYLLMQAYTGVPRKDPWF